jgi:hypothetical protein
VTREKGAGDGAAAARTRETRERGGPVTLASFTFIPM